MVRTPSLYKRIAEILLERLSSGAYPLGSTLPTEAQLVEEFGASHHTIRHALSLLSERGLIVRRAGSGSKVIATQEHTVFSHSMGNLKQLLRYPSSTYRDNLEAAHIVASAEEAEMLGCGVGTPWFRIRSLRRTGPVDKPLCWTDLYLLPRHSDVINQPDHGTTPVYEQVERVYGDRVEAAHVEISASRISAEQAHRLECEPGTPAIVVLRTYSDEDGNVFEVTRSIHPEDRYIFSLDFRRERKRR